MNAVEVIEVVKVGGGGGGECGFGCGCGCCYGGEGRWWCWGGWPFRMVVVLVDVGTILVVDVGDGVGGLGAGGGCCCIGGG